MSRKTMHVLQRLPAGAFAARPLLTRDHLITIPKPQQCWFCLCQRPSAIFDHDMEAVIKSAASAASLDGFQAAIQAAASAASPTVKKSLKHHKKMCLFYRESYRTQKLKTPKWVCRAPLDHFEAAFLPCRPAGRKNV